MSLAGVLWWLVVLMGTAGCAVHYYDRKTGTEHVWGVGHMTMKVVPPNEGVQAVVRSTSTAGLAVGSCDGQPYVALGWAAQQRVEVLDENTAIRFEWPDGFNSIRVGSAPPGLDPKPLQPPR